MFLDSAGSSTLDCSKRFTVDPLADSVHSVTNSLFLGSILPKQQLCVKTIDSHYYHHWCTVCIARYSLILIQLSELGHRGRGENENAQTLKQ